MNCPRCHQPADPVLDGLPHPGCDRAASSEMDLARAVRLVSLSLPDDLATEVAA